MTSPSSYFSSVDKLHMTADPKLTSYQLHSSIPGYQTPPSPYWHHDVTAAAAMTTLNPYSPGCYGSLMSGAWPTHKPEALVSEYGSYIDGSGFESTRPWCTSSPLRGGTVPPSATPFLPLTAGHHRTGSSNLIQLLDSPISSTDRSKCIWSVCASVCWQRRCDGFVIDELIRNIW